MFRAALLALLAFAASASAATCHYDCYVVAPGNATAAADAKSSLLQVCGVTDYKVSMDPASFAGIFKKAAPNGCTVAACGLFTDAAAIQTYRDGCEHPKPAYIANLQGKGGGNAYDGACTSCTA